MIRLAARVICGVVLVMGGLATSAHPQEQQQDQQVKRSERWRFLSPTQPVSDDPRRIPVAPGPHGPPGILVLQGGRIFDGTGAAARSGSLVIERNKIVKIVAPGAKDWPDTAHVIDVSGKTVLPGLIDIHTHICNPDPTDPPGLVTSPTEATLRATEHLRYYIESGITSIRDMASPGEVPFRLKEWVQQNRVVGPRVFAVGQLITGTGGHGSEGGLINAVDGGVVEALGADGWREAVRQQFKKGADVIKIASHFTPAEVGAAVQEAHALGLKITCDCETFYTRWAVEAGVDMIEHPLPRSDDTIRLMAEKGTEADPTQVPYMIIFDISGGYYDTPSRRFTFSKEANLEMVRKLKKAGIKMGVGTDLVADWYRYLPGPYITELKNFVKAGYTIQQALVTATKTNSELLDMNDKLGTLEPGKLADVTVINGKPDVDLDDLAKVDLVIRDGYIEVENGRAFIPYHTVVPMPSPKK